MNVGVLPWKKNSISCERGGLRKYDTLSMKILQIKLTHCMGVSHAMFTTWLHSLPRLCYLWFPLLTWSCTCLSIKYYKWICFSISVHLLRPILFLHVESSKCDSITWTYRVNMVAIRFHKFVVSLTYSLFV